MKPARSPILAGIACFAPVFALGFLLGTLRAVLARDAPVEGRLIDVLLFARAPVEPFSLYREARYALGLAAQIGFGLMPLIQLRQALIH